jgi:hypothetical protein
VNRDLLRRASAALAASQHADDLEVAAFYCARARIMLAKAKAELKEIALMLGEREAELVRRATPKQQITIGEAKP